MNGRDTDWESSIWNLASNTEPVYSTGSRAY